LTTLCCRIFGLIAYKNGLTRSSVDDLSAYTLLLSHVDWRKLYIHLRSLTVRHFGMVEAMELKKYDFQVIFNGMISLQNFIKNGSDVIKGQTDEMVIS
jgi:hypothetical protein